MVMAILEETAGPRSDQVDEVTRQLEALLGDHDPKTTKPVDFLRARFDAGLAWVWFPRVTAVSESIPLSS